MSDAAASPLHRLVPVLEDLVDGERCAIEGQDFDSLAEIQSRLDPIIERLVELAPVASDELRARVLALISRRDEHSEWLGQELAEAKAELGRINAGRRNVAKLAPVYGRPAAASSAQFTGTA